MNGVGSRKQITEAVVTAGIRRSGFNECISTITQLYALPCNARIGTVENTVIVVIGKYLTADRSRRNGQALLPDVIAWQEIQTEQDTARWRRTRRVARICARVGADARITHTCIGRNALFVGDCASERCACAWLGEMHFVTRAWGQVGKLVEARCICGGGGDGDAAFGQLHACACNQRFACRDFFVIIGVKPSMTTEFGARRHRDLHFAFVFGTDQTSRLAAARNTGHIQQRRTCRGCNQDFYRDGGACATCQDDRRAGASDSCCAYWCRAGPARARCRGGQSHARGQVICNGDRARAIRRADIARCEGEGDGYGRTCGSCSGIAGFDDFQIRQAATRFWEVIVGRDKISACEIDTRNRTAGVCIAACAPRGARVWRAIGSTRRLIGLRDGVGTFRQASETVAAISGCSSGFCYRVAIDIRAREVDGLTTDAVIGAIDHAIAVVINEYRAANAAVVRDFSEVVTR